MLINGKQVLPLTLNKKWFDMILSGEKKQEYREYKEYWFKRLITGYNHQFTGLVGKDYEKEFLFKHFNQILFTNGYNPNSPSMLVELKNIEIGKGNPEWGGSDKDVFILNLGEIIETKNC